MTHACDSQAQDRTTDQTCRMSMHVGRGTQQLASFYNMCMLGTVLRRPAHCNGTCLLLLHPRIWVWNVADIPMMSMHAWHDITYMCQEGEGPQDGSGGPCETMQKKSMVSQRVWWGGDFECFCLCSRTCVGLTEKTLRLCLSLTHVFLWI